MSIAKVAPLVLVAGLAVVLLARGDRDTSRTTTGGPDIPAAGATAHVERVVDGDTIIVRLDGRRQRVRYIGVDTPESVKPDTPVQCFAERASHENDRLVAGRDVRLVPDREARDRFGRLLAYVYRRPDGLFVNRELVRLGYARTLTIAPNTRHRAAFATLQDQARRQSLGLWGDCPTR